MPSQRSPVRPLSHAALYERIATARERVFALAEEAAAIEAQVAGLQRPAGDGVASAAGLRLQEAANELGRLEALLASLPTRRFVRSSAR
jgi:hypothetical protein